MFRETQDQEPLSSPNLERRQKIGKFLAGLALAVAVVKDGGNIGEALFMPAVEFNTAQPVAESVMQQVPGQQGGVAAAIDRFEAAKHTDHSQDMPHEANMAQTVFEELKDGFDMPEEDRQVTPPDGGVVDAAQYPNDKSAA